MKCMMCGATLTASDQCPRCGVDVAIYKRIIRLSNTFYNKGLEDARERNLTGAIHNLKKSLKYYKRNIPARNLLGLVYFEMGDAVAALQEWIISKSINKEKNIAENYLQMIQTNTAELENINIATKKYNLALLYCEQQSYDLAMIQLKKVISMTPGFLKAQLLLALMYLSRKEYHLASVCVEYVLSIDRKNEIALRYQEEVKSHKKQEVKEEKEIRKQEKKKQNTQIMYSNGHDTVIMPKTAYKETTGFSTVLSIVIGLVLGAALVFFLIRPSIIKNAQTEAKKSLIDASEEIADKNTQINELESEVEKAKKKKEDAEQKTKKDAEVIEAYEELLTAMGLYLEQDSEGSIEALEKIDSTKLESDTIKNLYETIRGKVGSEVVKTYYDKAMKEYVERNYVAAVEDFQKAVNIDETYEKGNALYLLAFSYYRLQDWDHALENFQRLQNVMPDSEVGRASSEYITAIEQKKTGGQ